MLREHEKTSVVEWDCQVAKHPDFYVSKWNLFLGVLNKLYDRDSGGYVFAASVHNSHLKTLFQMYLVFLHSHPHPVCNFGVGCHGGGVALLCCIPIVRN